jgi:hypothetical protein
MFLILSVTMTDSSGATEEGFVLEEVMKSKGRWKGVGVGSGVEVGIPVVVGSGVMVGVGVGVATSKALLRVSDRPSGLVTWTSYLPLANPAGTIAVSRVSLIHSEESNPKVFARTVAPLWKPLPRMVICVSWVLRTQSGSTSSMSGGGTGVEVGVLLAVGVVVDVGVLVAVSVTVSVGLPVGVRLSVGVNVGVPKGAVGVATGAA